MSSPFDDIRDEFADIQTRLAAVEAASGVCPREVTLSAPEPYTSPAGNCNGEIVMAIGDATVTPGLYYWTGSRWARV